MAIEAREEFNSDEYEWELKTLAQKEIHLWQREGAGFSPGFMHGLAKHMANAFAVTAPEEREVARKITHNLITELMHDHNQRFRFKDLHERKAYYERTIGHLYLLVADWLADIIQEKSQTVGGQIAETREELDRQL